MRIKPVSLSAARPPDHLPDRLACNWMLVSAGLAISFHFSHLPVWLTSFAACILLWRFAIENHAWRVPKRWLRWSLLLISAIFVFKEYGSLLGREPGVAYLTLLVCLKILEIRTLRDYLLAIFLMYILLLGALLFSQSLLTGLYMSCLIVVTTHALILLNRPHPLSHRESLKLGLTLCLQALPLLLILYLLFPRIQGTLWGLPQDAFSGRTGMSEQVSPGSINRLYNDEAVAFRVEFDGQRPHRHNLYWRAFVLSETDGRTWYRHRGPGDGAARWRYRAYGPPIQYTVLLEPHYQQWLPALDLPLPMQGRGRIKMINGYALESAATVRSLQRYRLASHPHYSTTTLGPGELLHNKHWPIKPSRRVQKLIKGWRHASSEPKEIVNSALRFFEQQPFYYTLTPPLLSGDTLDAFLFDTRAGYCEHYASAFVALMRLGGIPARLVAGYQGGEWNAAGEYLVVRQADAHAWAEVWLQQEGWVRVDPTAAVAPERIELGADAIRRLSAQGAAIGRLSIFDAERLLSPSWIRRVWQHLSWRWDVVNSKWNMWVMDYGREMQFELMRTMGFTAPTWLNAVMIMAAGIGLILLLISALWMHRRQKPDPVVKVYQKFCRKLAKTGLHRAPSEGPLDFCRRLIHVRADLREPVSSITAAYIELRYGNFNPAGLDRFRHQVAAFKAV